MYVHQLLYMQFGSYNPILILVYVENPNDGKRILILKKVKILPDGKFEMNMLHYFPSIKLNRTPWEILFSQCHYVLSLFLKVSITDYNLIMAPFNKNKKMHLESNCKIQNRARYKQIINTVIYLTINVDPTLRACWPPSLTQARTDCTWISLSGCCIIFVILYEEESSINRESQFYSRATYTLVD